MAAVLHLEGQGHERVCEREASPIGERRCDWVSCDTVQVIRGREVVRNVLFSQPSDGQSQQRGFRRLRAAFTPHEIVMRRLTTGILVRFEKCVVRRFRRCATVIVYLHKPRQYSVAYYTSRLYGIAYCS